MQRQRVSPGAGSFILQTGFIQLFHKKNEVRVKKSAAVTSREMSACKFVRYKKVTGYFFLCTRRIHVFKYHEGQKMSGGLMFPCSVW